MNLRRLSLAGTILALLAPSAASGQDETVAKILPLSGKILDIEGTASGVSAEVVTLKSAAAGLAARNDSLSVRETGEGLRVAMKGDVLFAFDSAAIQPAAAKTLAALAAIIEKAGRPVIVEGHTDSKGTARHNRVLSQERAEAVVAWLARHQGVDPAGFIARGRGAAEPIASNTMPDGQDDPAGRQQNRRVEFVLPAAKQ